MIQEMRYTFSVNEITKMIAAHLRVDAGMIRQIEVVRAGDKRAPVFGGLIFTVEKRDR